MKRIEIPITTEKANNSNPIKKYTKEEILKKYDVSFDDRQRANRAYGREKTPHQCISMGITLYNIINNSCYDETTDLKTVVDLISNGADIDHYDLKNCNNPVIICVKRNYIKTLLYLLMSGANIDQKDYEGNNLLMLAIIHNYKEIIEILIKFGINIDTKNKYGYNARYIAKSHNMLEFFDALTKPNEVINVDDALNEIIYKDNKKLIKKKSSFKRIQ